MIDRLGDVERRFISQRTLVFFAVALGPLILVGKELIVGRVLYWGTPALQFIPWWVEGIRQISQGSVPLWNSLNGMGAPLLANYQSAFFYPPNWILFFFHRLWDAAGLAWGFTFLVMLHLIWGGAGMAVFLRRLGASPLAQALGGTAFGLSGYWIGRLEFISMIWVGAWIPWLLLAIHDLTNPVHHNPAFTKRHWIHIPLVVVLAMMLLAGHAQLTWYALELGATWLVTGTIWNSGWRDLPRSLGRFFTAGVISGFLAAVQLIPTAEYLLQSQRASAVNSQLAMVYSFWPWRLVSLLAPDFFGSPGKGNFWGYASYWEDHAYLGVLMMFMAIGTIGLLTKKKNLQAGWLSRRMAWLLWVIIVVSLVLAFGFYTPIYPFLYRHVPTFNMFQAPARTLVWLIIALIILGAYGVDRWRYPGGKGLYWLRLGTAGAFAVALGAGLGWVFLQNVKLTFILATAMFGVWALGTGILGLLAKYKDRPGWQIAWPVLVFGWLLADLLVAGWQLNPTVQADFYTGTSDQISQLRSSLSGQRVFLSQSNEYFLKFDRFLRFRDYRVYEDLQEIKRTLLPNSNLYSGIALASNFDPFIPNRFSTWMDVVNRLPEEKRRNLLAMMNVGAVEKIDGSAINGVRFDQIGHGAAAAIYPCPKIIQPSSNSLLLMSQRGYSQNMLVLESNQIYEQGECESAPPLIVEPIVMGNGKIDLDVSGKSGWLFISQVWYPGWRATIDGMDAQIYRANYLFMAVNVPVGSKKIILQYHPISFQVGVLLSILMLIVLCYIIIVQNRKNRRMAILAADSNHRSI